MNSSDVRQNLVNCLNVCNSINWMRLHCRMFLGLRNGQGPQAQRAVYSTWIAHNCTSAFDPTSFCWNTTSIRTSLSSSRPQQNAWLFMRIPMARRNWSVYSLYSMLILTLKVGLITRGPQSKLYVAC